jgi:DNA ligase D-like protein (predicted ligase)/DNA ligase D-like protein (predicted 3'-phosphoesterase)
MPRTALDKYQEKRDFRRTKEPKGRVGREGRGRKSHGGRFVVQKHAARRLHYDFRLELDGVLKSWAVTRGPSLDPADKRLAVRTEDHPLEYRKFEGVIPKGEYGGGTVMLWDRGRWSAKSDPHEGLARGTLKFELQGKRLRGGFALVRLKPRADRPERTENWLLIKERDATADAEIDAVDAWQTSITTGRDLDQIAASESPAAEPAGARRRTDRKRGGSSRLALPDFIAPQLATLRTTAPDGDQWLHEIKYDGYRIIAAVADTRAKLYTRSGQDWTHRFRPLAAALQELPCANALLDGEVVILDEGGRSDFSALQRAIKHGSPDFMLMAFDLLHADGMDLRRQPQIERKRRLQELLAGCEGGIRYSDHEIGRGPEVLAHACRMKLEGIISKRVDAAYTSRRSRNWIKAKCTGRDEFVIGGYRRSTVRGRPFSSLLVGEYVGDQLHYRGRVGTGYNERVLAELGSRLQRLARKRSPFVGTTPASERDACWVKPELVAEIAYTERTRDGVLRHPSYVGLREDKNASDVQAPEPYR